MGRIWRPRWRWTAILAFGLGVLLLAGNLLSNSIFNSPRSQGPEGRRKYDFPAQAFDIPPIDRPRLVPAEEARIDDDAVIIGIVVEGEPRAYLRDAFAAGPAWHIVRDKIQATPIAVTHCDRLLCTRVFVGQDPARPLSIRVGGWREDRTMDLIINNNRYSQKSPVIPLAEIPISEVKWGQWREQYPNTLIYLGAYHNS